MKTPTLTLASYSMAAGLALFALAPAARAEVDEIKVAYQFGLSYLPLMVMQDQKLIEKHAQASGLRDFKASFNIMGGPGLINDGLLSGSVHFGSVGVPSLVTLWDRTRGNLGVRAVGALNSMPMYLNTVNPNVRTIRDFTEKDKIALPTVKVSVQAVTLQMAAAKEFGDANYAQLDKFTVSMSHPDGMTALLSGRSEITGHFTSPPFQYQELDANRGVRRLLNSYDVLGGPSTFTLVVATSRFRDANPKAYEAFAKAFEEAQAWINANKRAAGEFYLKFSNSKEDLADIIKQMNDPEIIFTTTPQNIMKYADFMHKVGSIRNRPADWKEMTFPNLHARQGS